MDGDQRTEVTIGSLAFMGFLWLLTGYLAVEALSFSFEARVAPLLFGGLGFILLTYLLVRDSMRFLASWSAVRQAKAGRAPAESAPPGLAEGPTAVDEAIAIAWIVGSVILLLVFGFVVGMTVAMFLIVRVYAHERVRTAVGLTAGVMAVTYFVFGQLLNTSLYAGLLELFG